MSGNDVFWERVNAALDERRDPLGDERVQELVAEDPRRLDELLALRERLAQLPAPRRRRFVSKVAAIAAVVLIGGAALMFAMRDHDKPVATVPAVASAPTPTNAASESRSCVISFRAHVVTESANTRTTIDFDGEHVVRSREFFSQPSNDDTTHSQPAFVASIVHLNP